MTRIAAFQRDSGGMEHLKKKVEQTLAAQREAHPDSPDFHDRLLLRDILLTQREVLSAMLYAQTEEKGAKGVLVTENGCSARIPARPMPERDLWFERVWKRFQEGQAD